MLVAKLFGEQDGRFEFGLRDSFRLRSVSTSRGWSSPNDMGLRQREASGELVELALDGQGLPPRPIAFRAKLFHLPIEVSVPSLADSPALHELSLELFAFRRQLWARARARSGIVRVSARAGRVRRSGRVFGLKLFGMEEGLLAFGTELVDLDLKSLHLRAVCFLFLGQGGLGLREAGDTLFIAPCATARTGEDQLVLGAELLSAEGDFRVFALQFLVPLPGRFVVRLTPFLLLREGGLGFLKSRQDLVSFLAHGPELTEDRIVIGQEFLEALEGLLPFRLKLCERGSGLLSLLPESGSAQRLTALS